MKNFIKRLLQKWIDQMRYKIEHDVDEPEDPSKLLELLKND